MASQSLSTTQAAPASRSFFNRTSPAQLPSRDVSRPPQNQQQPPTQPASAAPTSQPYRPAPHDQRQLERDRILERDRLQRDGPSLLAELTDEQREEITEAFQLFDLNHDDHLSFHEFRVALRALGFQPPKPDLVQDMRTHGVAHPRHRSDSAALAATARTPRPSPSAPPPPPATVPTAHLLLGREAFAHLAAGRLVARDPAEEVLRAFALFDADGKGFISADDLRRVSRELGEGLEEEEVRGMVEEFDLDGRGGVGKEEFLMICLGP